MACPGPRRRGRCRKIVLKMQKAAPIEPLTVPLIFERPMRG